MVAEIGATKFDGRSERRLSSEVEQEIARAIARIDYGSVEIVIHDGKVVQIECREKIRVAGGRDRTREISRID